MGHRQEALDTLEKAPAPVIDELSRHPDLADFCGDPGFTEMREKIKDQGKGCLLQ
jgi:hypothetical protein